MQKVITDPADILKFGKEELVNLYDITCRQAEDLEAQKKAIKDVLADKMETDGEMIGGYSVTKAKRINFKVDLEEAKSLGATKIAIDNSVLKQLYNKGVEIAHEVTTYLIIKEIIKKED